MEKYISYYRVSTKKQGEKGHGLDAQKTAVKNFLDARKAEQIESFTEIDSRTKNDRPILRSAIEKCKETGAQLLVSKLDRLAGEAGFIFNLRNELERSGIGFTIATMPNADRLTIGILAVVAENEVRIIRQRTKEGLKEAKAKGVELGNPDNLTQQAREKAWATTRRKARTNENTRKAWHFIEPRREQGISYAQIAVELNKEGYRTPRDKKFHPAQVHKIYKRFSDSDQRQTPMKRKIEIEKLKRCAIELNEELGLEPPIEIIDVDRHYLEDKLREAIGLILEADEFSTETEQIIKHYQ